MCGSFSPRSCFPFWELFLPGAESLILSTPLLSRQSANGLDGFCFLFLLSVCSSTSGIVTIFAANIVWNRYFPANQASFFRILCYWPPALQCFGEHSFRLSLSAFKVIK